MDIRDYIDHTLLKPDARRDQIETLCKEAMENGFYSVCVNSCWVELCAGILNGHGSPVKVCTVVGFPLGAMESRAKALEAKRAVDLGADEVDMVINIGALKSGDLKTVEEDIRGVVEASGPETLVKVIIETALLSDKEKISACEIAKKAGADFVKTSTGFSTAGATVSDVALMRKTVGPGMGVKAAGGVRSYEDAKAMISAGATRLGTSSGISLVQGEEVSGSDY